jgi:hypothetical protein
LSFQASAAALASLRADTFAPGLMIEAAIAPHGSRWSLSLAGLLDGKHHRALGGGEAEDTPFKLLVSARHWPRLERSGTRLGPSRTRLHGARGHVHASAVARHAPITAPHQAPRDQASMGAKMDAVYRRYGWIATTSLLLW